MNATPEDRHWMARALELAAVADGRTSPNPTVGAVVVRDGKVVGEGWHTRAGEEHAEAAALRSAGESARGADLYVTLEPCAHQGRTPPCAGALVDAGIRRVVAAMEDPDPRTKGRGFQALEAGGVAVDVGVRGDEARRANEAYLHRVRTGRAFGVLKAAVTLDGRLGADSGDSRWISGERSRKRAHELRDRYDVVLIGRRTLETDDPRLDVRLEGDRRDPVAVVVDTELRGPRERRLWDRARAGARVIVAAGETASEAAVAAREKQGVEVWRLPVDNKGRVELLALFARLAEDGHNSVMVEGGQRLHTSCLASGLIGRAHVFVAPRFLGGVDGPRLVGDLGVRQVADSLRLYEVTHELLGEDVLFSGRVGSEPGEGG